VRIRIELYLIMKMKISLILCIVLLIPCAIWAGEDDDFEENDKEDEKNKSPKDKEADAKKALKEACGKSAKLQPLNGGAGPVIKTSDLECKFDVLQACNWGNGRNSSIKWGIVDTADVDEKTFKSSFDTPKKPDGSFAAAPSGPTEETDEATLVSGIIPCQKEPGQLSFGHYLTDGVKLKVCKKNLDKSIIEGSCQEFIGTDKAAVTAIPGGPPNQFRIAFIASGYTDGGVAIIKDIVYGGKICQISS